jgi:hypothetical protein
MSTFTVLGDMSSGQIAEALASRLGPRYRVEQGKRLTWGFGTPKAADSDNIVVSAGSGRFRRAQVTIERGGGDSIVRIDSPGPIQLTLLNMAGIGRKVRRVLLSTPELGAKSRLAAELPAALGSALQARHRRAAPPGDGGGHPPQAQHAGRSTPAHQFRTRDAGHGQSRRQPANKRGLDGGAEHGFGPWAS